MTKRDGRREEFMRGKLRASITMACAKRSLPTGSIERAMEHIETELADIGRAEIPSRVIGDMVLDRLKRLDPVAYLRFASVYKGFSDLQSFREEVDALLQPGETEEVPTYQLSFLDKIGEGVSVPRRPRTNRRTRRAQPAQG